ncbi:MAG: glycerate kinase [Chloroflexota bacterium]
MLDYADHRFHLDTILRAALKAADPAEAVRRHWRESDLDGVGRVFIVGAGKAGVAMAEAAADLLGPRLTRGVVAVPQLPITNHQSPITFIPAGHPRPSEGSLRAGDAIAELLSNTTEHDLVLALISGGGSALLDRLVPGITLDDLQSLTDGLLRSGAPINEVNCVRKHLSLIKGGGLARMAAPARVLSLILSDVIDDPLDVIASGPTVPDPTTVEDAKAILQKYGVGAIHESPLRETPKPGDPIFDRVTNRLVGSNALARNAAADAARSLGFIAHTPPVTVQGEAREWFETTRREVLRKHFASDAPQAFIFGGETTVTVRGNGMGGRNQELVLAAAIALEGVPQKVVVASVGTDGVDGPTPAAGAFATPESVSRARALGLDAVTMLANNDSHSFFSALGDCIITGPTGTNVNDLVIVLVYG